jgi:AsmA-like C-terminal region
MSDILTETIPRQDAVEPTPPDTRAAARWIKRVVLLLVLLWIASEAASLAVQHTGLRRVLTDRLQSAFGRPVDVRSYDFSVWDGFALEANSVVVQEDPRFGQEYFLRADSMAVRLRWVSLLGGRVEFGTLSLSHPSLNLVRNDRGAWNLTEWLPQPGAHPASPVPVGPAFPSSALRFRRVEVDGGRINFKNGYEKLPFAFVDVKGTVETDRPGRWSMNLEATPWRAAVITQQAGTIHLSGDLGGTSSRLRPAVLNVSWTDASISDVLRLSTGNDAGIRGALALAVDARTGDNGDAWTLKAHALLQQIHRWDLAPRSDNPPLDLSATATWNPSAPSVEISRATLDAPHSHADATGSLNWANEPQLAKRPAGPARVIFSDANMDMRDVLAWVTAFHSGMAPDLAVRGFAHTHAELSGWPPRLTSAVVSSPGIDFSAGALRRPAHLGALDLHYDRAIVTFPPVALALGAGDDAVRFESSLNPPRAATNTLHISANVSEVHNVLAAAGALGWNLARGWDVSGPARADLRWQGAQFPWREAPVGYISWGAGPGVSVVRVPFLNQPIGGINAVTEWKPGSRHIALASAEAFGAHWTGSFDRRDNDLDTARDWQFSLAGDHLSAADLDRWLNPAWRESFIDRVLPFLASRNAAAAAPRSLRASGHIVLDQFALAPLAVRELQGDLEIDGRHLTFSNATGQFYGGEIAGTLEADLAGAPVYHANLDFSRVDAAALAAATPALAGVTAKLAGGQISITASGANRSDIFTSLACQGTARAISPRLLNVDLLNPEGSASPGAKSTQFTVADAAFSCAARKIDFQNLSLGLSLEVEATGSGTIDFSRNLDLRLQTHHGGSLNEDAATDSLRLTGTLAAPKVTSIPALTRRSR